MIDKIQISSFPAVSKTALLPLYCKAADYQAVNSILKDKFSYDLYNRIEFDWEIIKKSIRITDPLLMAVRVRKFDRMCMQFLEKHPDGIIVNLGSGLDNRFNRIDNGRCLFVDLDFPEVIEFKKLITPASKRNIMIGQSILDYSWIRQISNLSSEYHSPVFFIMEGVMMFLELTEIQLLFKNICRTFPHSEIFFDIFSEKGKKYAETKSVFQDLNVKIKTGLNSGKPMESWGIGFKVLSEWYFSNDPDAKKGLMKLVWAIPGIKKLQYFIHGRFDK